MRILSLSSSSCVKNSQGFANLTWWVSNDSLEIMKHDFVSKMGVTWDSVDWCCLLFIIIIVVILEVGSNELCWGGWNQIKKVKLYKKENSDERKKKSNDVVKER